MTSKITLNNIRSVINAYTNLFLTKIGTKPEYYKEQIAYRLSICKESCLFKGKCEHCGCKVPDKLFDNKSCNKGIKFPDIMNEQDWIKFKEDNGIK